MAEISLFMVANAVVLLFCAWVTHSDLITTGVWGTVGFSLIGVAATVNLFKPAWMRHTIDGPEILMLVGMAIAVVWFVSDQRKRRNGGLGNDGV